MNKEEFKHITADGTVLKAEDMETAHLFNCIKMWYNHLAVLVGFKIYGLEKRKHTYFTLGKLTHKKV